MVESEFATQLADSSLVLRVVDIAENEELADQYEITWSALLVNRYKDGKESVSVSVGEQRVRNWLERVLLFRPRTKEFLIAYPAIAAAYCCAAHRSRLTAWLFGVFGAIGFASVANTFCHIRAHFLVSLLRTGIGLVLGLMLGAIVLLILRACWPTPSGSTQTKE